MRVYKNSYKDRQGVRHQTKLWYIECRDHHRHVRRLPAFKDKAASESLGRQLEKLVSFRVSNGVLDPAMLKWLESVPVDIRNLLVRWGILEKDQATVGQPLRVHLADFLATLRSHGITEAHSKRVTNRARKVIEECGFVYWSQITASAVERFLATLRKTKKVEGKKEKKGLSVQTSNFYLQSIKQFCKFMVMDGRAIQSPIAHLKALNIRVDRRHDRRALTLKELLHLLTKTADGEAFDGITGPERSLLYRFAAETGLRAGEIRSLTCGSFDLDAKPPTVTVAAGYSKHRREDVVPLRPDTAEVMRDQLRMKLPMAPAFRLPSRYDLVDMLKADLVAAGIEYRDDANQVVDFQALRHTFITNLVNSGVHPRVAQKLARHSTITLTMDRYSHTLMDEQTQALAKLPDLTIRPADGKDEKAAQGGQTG
jgi:integrase